MPRLGVAEQTAEYRRRFEEVAASLLAAMALPAPSGAALVALMGLPGSGKSHFARVLAASLGGVVVGSDELRRALFVAPSYARGETDTVFRVAHAMARRLLEAGHVVIFDATNLVDRDRRPLRRIAGAVGAPFALVHVAAPEPAIIDRLGRRASRADASDADERVYRMMRERLEAPSGSVVAVDTTEDLDAAARRVAAAIGR